MVDPGADQAWVNIAALALNLVSWLQLAALPDRHHAKAWDVKRWRYRLFATAGKIITSARRNHLLLPAPPAEKDLLTLLLANTGRLKQLMPAPGRTAADSVPTNSPATGRGTGANPKRTNGPHPLPENRKQMPVNPPPLISHHHPPS